MQFRKYMWKYKYQYLLGIVLLSISSLLQMVIPLLLERFTDEIQQLKTTPRAVLDVAMWIAIIGFVVALFRSFSRIYMFRLTRILERNIRKSLFAMLRFLSYSRQFVRPLMDVANVFNNMQSGLAGVERVFEVLDEREEPEDSPKAIA
ncbi:hypothetical protein KZ483_12075 [Paenibacillus sp. sptzw28]|uniref:hypothetical protein n=1 Tax=Paenibacillus sp. sptzw28 TaxID=715179 RepID=UPI001C6F56B1|nr:hypothetical protein [Paenibacillus sp. sptzw28]QYR24410.1 hypothetical protein KZ483_12075 [Paenibacillus sp. sptzw28]